MTYIKLILIFLDEKELNFINHHFNHHLYIIFLFLEDHDIQCLYLIKIFYNYSQQPIIFIIMILIFQISLLFIYLVVYKPCHYLQLYQKIILFYQILVRYSKQKEFLNFIYYFHRKKKLVDLCIYKQSNDQISNEIHLINKYIYWLLFYIPRCITIIL